MISISVLVLALSAFAITASAEVRFGNNLRIGGHDVSGQMFTKQKRGTFIIHENEPENAGCVWRQNTGGSRTKVCNLKKQKTRESR